MKDEERRIKDENQTFILISYSFYPSSLIPHPSSFLGLCHSRRVSAHAVKRLFDNPAKDCLIVIVVSEHILAGREAVMHALLLHLIQLVEVKLLILDGPPIDGRGIHREAGGERAV